MSGRWDPATEGLLALPSGRAVRGRGVGRPLPAGPTPEFGLYLLARRPAVPWQSRWVRWPDFRLPADPADLRPTTLGLMHGPSYAGDCATALRDLADAYDERLRVEGFRLHGPVAPGAAGPG